MLRFRAPCAEEKTVVVFPPSFIVFNAISIYICMLYAYVCLMLISFKIEKPTCLFLILE